MNQNRRAAFNDWKRKAADADILDVAQTRCGAKLKKAGGREYVGPCPACGGEDRFGINAAKGVYNCRGAGGGDVIQMVMHCCGVDFIAACEIITGEPPADREASERPQPLPEELAKQEAERAERERQRDDDENIYRDKERKIAFEMWLKAVPIAGTAAEAYLKLRGIPELPAGISPAALRCIPDMPYYLTRDKNAEEVHRGPALLAAIVGGRHVRATQAQRARFSGAHITHLDLAQRNGKLALPHPDKPSEVCDAKKVRGSQAGGYIPLVDCAEPKWLIIGEGIEKTLAVWFALLRGGRDLADGAFWTSVNLQNLGGKSAGSVLHPSKRNPKTNRRESVQGPFAKLDEPSIVIPDSVDDVLILGDGSSDRFATQCAIARAAQRFTSRGDRPARIVRVAWSPDDADFDDLLRAAA